MARGERDMNLRIGVATLVDNVVSLYGVFDGHDGSRPANFAAQRMPAELLLGQLNNKTTDDEIKEILRLAFTSVERGWMESIDDALAKKARLQLEIPEGVRSAEAMEQYKDVLDSLAAIEMDIRGGSTAVLALTVNNRLYIANIGCSRALLCTTDEGGVLRLTQLTVDHILGNEDERARLAGLGLDVDAVRTRGGGKIGEHSYTRTLGDYSIKSGYKEYDYLRDAPRTPIIAEPELYGGIELDSSCSFLLLFSDGLYQTLEEATGTEHVNRDIASMVAAEFAAQSTLNGVAQAVVDKAARIHHDTYLASTDHRQCLQRDDITLIVRNFNYPMPNAVNSSPCCQTTSSAGINNTTSGSSSSGGAMFQPLSLVIPTSPGRIAPAPQLIMSSQPSYNPSYMMPQTATSTLTSNITYTSSNDSSSGELHPFAAHGTQSGPPRLPLDSDGKLEAYIDFTVLNNALNALSDEERATLELKPGYETIPEEQETISPAKDEQEVVKCLDFGENMNTPQQDKPSDLIKPMDDIKVEDVESDETLESELSAEDQRRKEDEDMGFEIIGELMNNTSSAV